MKCFSIPPLGGRVAVCLLWLSTTYLFGQAVKEDRNYYPQKQKTEKTKLSFRQTPFVFSPYLSYKEQKKMQMAKKQIGGITFTVKKKRAKDDALGNYKRPILISKSKKNSFEQNVVADTSKPFIRYEFPDSTSK
ncbi:MAG: hypothetical protein R2822_14780 [Spirosomataceae bacterium]